MAIDMWSFGCILAELYTGYPLFPGENEVEQLACIMEIFGMPSPSLLGEAQRRKLFFGKYITLPFSLPLSLSLLFPLFVLTLRNVMVYLFFSLQILKVTLVASQTPRGVKDDLEQESYHLL